MSSDFLAGASLGVGGAAAKTKMVDTTQLMASMGGANDQINLMETVRYLRESKLARKISGFVEMTEEEAARKGRSVCCIYPRLYADQQHHLAVGNQLRLPRATRLLRPFTKSRGFSCH